MICQPTNKKVRGLFAAALVLACAFSTVTYATAQRVTPPAGNTSFLEGNATGTQGYTCLPTATGASWTVNGARPEATLFTKFFGQNVQIIAHFLSPDTNPNENAPSPLAFGN